MLDSGVRFAYAFLPAGVAIIVGIVLAIRRRRSEPAVAHPALIGLVLHLIAVLLPALLLVLLPALTAAGHPPEQIRALSTGIGLATLVVTLVAWTLLLTALFRRLPAAAQAPESPTAAAPESQADVDPAPPTGPMTAVGEEDRAPTGRHALLDESGAQVEAGTVLLPRPGAGRAGAAGAGAAAVGVGAAAYGWSHRQDDDLDDDQDDLETGHDPYGTRYDTEHDAGYVERVREPGHRPDPYPRTDPAGIPVPPSSVAGRADEPPTTVHRVVPAGAAAPGTSSESAADDQVDDDRFRPARLARAPRPVEQRPVEQRPVEQRPVEQRPVDPRPPEQPAAGPAPTAPHAGAEPPTEAVPIIRFAAPAATGPRGEADPPPQRGVGEDEVGATTPEPHAHDPHAVEPEPTGTGLGGTVDGDDDGEAGPVEPEAAAAGHAGSEPVEIEHAGVEHAEPIDAEHAQAEHAEPGDAEHAQAEHAEPADSEPVEADAVDASPADADQGAHGAAAPDGQTAPEDGHDVDRQEPSTPPEPVAALDHVPERASAVPAHGHGASETSESGGHAHHPDDTDAVVDTDGHHADRAADHAGRSHADDPADADPAVPEPAVPEPAVPEPAVPEPAVPDPAVLEPAVPDQHDTPPAPPATAPATGTIARPRAPRVIPVGAGRGRGAPAPSASHPWFGSASPETADGHHHRAEDTEEPDPGQTGRRTPYDGRG